MQALFPQMGVISCKNSASALHEFVFMTTHALQGVLELDDAFKEETLSLSWGRLVNGRQVVGT